MMPPIAPIQSPTTGPDGQFSLQWKAYFASLEKHLTIQHSALTASRDATETDRNSSLINTSASAYTITIKAGLSDGFNLELIHLLACYYE